MNGVYTQRYNKRHSCDGQLFKGRYKAIVVESDSYALELVRYIHRNPLEAGVVDNLQKYQWSSHKPYLSNAKKWQWLYKEYIFRLFSNSRQEGIRAYKRFVFQETLPEINQIFSQKKIPSVLGSKRFIEKIKIKFFNQQDFEFVPEIKRLAPDADEIIDIVCEYYKTGKPDLFKSRRGRYNEPRNVAIYLIRYLRNDTIQKIADLFGITRCSTVSSVIDRVKIGINESTGLEKRIKEMKNIILKSQERT